LKALGDREGKPLNIENWSVGWTELPTNWNGAV
jgi:hypothetical protein